MFSKYGFDSASQFSTSLSVVVNGETFGTIPLTLNQISKSDFSVSVDVNVTVVGNVSNIVENYASVIFTLDDGTGKLICERLLTEQIERLQTEEIREGICVRVDGHLKSFKGGKRLVVFNLRPVTHSDKTTFHFSACTNNHTHTSKSKIQGDRGNDSAPFCVDGVNKSEEKMVLDYLQHPKNFYKDTGVHRDQIKKELKLPVDKIRHCISFLEEEGMIYQIVDEYHYKAVSDEKWLGDRDNLLSSTQNTSTNGSTPTFSSQDSVPFCLDGDLRMVLDYLQLPKNSYKDTGTYIDEIKKELKLPVNKIWKAITILVDEGMIYTTIDEYHFKSVYI